MRANTFYILQYDFVCVQTRFTSCNTISYACKHVLRLVIRFRTHANTFYIVAATDSEVNMTVTSLQQTIRGSIRPLHRCSKRFGGRNDRYIVAANDSGVEMTVTLLQQTIRRSIWPLHRCSKRFGGRNDRYIAAIAHSEGKMGFYIIATRHNSYVTCGYVAGSVKFASIPEFLPANAPISLTVLQSCRQKRHER